MSGSSYGSILSVIKPQYINESLSVIKPQFQVSQNLNISMKASVAEVRPIRASHKRVTLFYTDFNLSAAEAELVPLPQIQYYVCKSFVEVQM